jgi:hypothetical protein
MKCTCTLENKVIWDHRHWPPNLKRSKVNNAKLLQACVHVFLTVTRSISAAVLILSVIIIFLKMLSAMEITKCSDSSQSTFQYFNHGYFKFFHSQSGSFFRVFAILTPKITTQFLFFNWVRLLDIYFCWIFFFKTFHCCLLTFCSIFKLSVYHL